MRTLSTLVLGTSLLSILAASACNKSDSPNEDSAEGAIDSTDSASAEGNLLMAAVDGSATGKVTADSVTATIAANITARYTPAGCVTVTPSGATIKAVYNDCTGPRGLAHVTGEVDLAVSVSLNGEVQVHGTSTDLKVNGATLDIDATGTYATSGSGHSLTVETTGTGTGPRGLLVDHEGSYTITWDAATQCHSIEGEWSTELGLRERSNEVNVSRCGGGCPTGTISHSYLGGRTLTVTFDGTATASWSLAASGPGASVISTGTVALSCQ